MYDDYEDGSEGGSTLGRKIALGVGVLAVAALGWFVVTNVTGGKGGQVRQSDAAAAAVAPTTSGDPADSRAAGPDDSVSSEEAPTTTGGSEAAASTTELTEAPPTTAATPPTEAPTTTAAPTTVAPPPTNPDGTPAWVVAIYDETSITLNGAVPDAASKQKLQDLAVANAKPGQAATVNNNLTINPSVPRDVGARVVELTSARFDDGSAVIQPAHGAELDRVANVMNLLPNVTALVIGHADQRGSEVSNYVLSKDRADAVVDYLVQQGIDPSRLSARAVGESDLLSLNNDAAALALNKRTEFVLFGLLQ
jgi:outer membrane protein OmpA-like peptidoglycan-associated protein